ncbi:MAG TPA: DUF6624 domain-containing protein [Fimbriimonadaceae bacterium]|nr:DUF6624 domain-containing protein [Fimbriimonadaceae bacterium]
MILIPFPVAQSTGIADARFRLQAMVMQDQEVRKHWIAEDKAGKKDEALIAEMHRIDREDTAEMKRIVDQFGWPTITAFGKEGAFDAWLIVQHADQDPRFQERCLTLMAALLPRKEVDSENYAYLADRVSVKKTGRQLYGTQCKIVNGKVILDPVIDPRRLDRRRKAMGMMPIQQYLKLVGDMYLPRR